MAECRDFFDELTSASPRSSSLVNKTSPSEDMPEHCLELTLGLGPAVGASCSLQVRPASAYNCLPKQPSGNFAFSASFVPTSDLSQTSLSLKDSPKGLQNPSGEAEATGLVNQRSGDFAPAATHPLSSFGGQTDMGMAAKSLFPSGDTAFPSLDQIWLKLQRNGAVFGQDVQDPHEASSMWDRRSASMHVMIPHKDVGGEAKNDQIRRSSSSGVFSLTASRRISSIESSLKMSPQKNIVFSQEHDQESLEDLRKRKELQAERRQVARKRRRIATEEKQHKKSKQSSTLQGLGSRQSISLNDKFSLGETHTGEGLLQESHCASPEALENECQKNSMQMSQNLHAEERKQETLSQCAKEDKLDTLAGSVDEVEGSSHYMPSERGVSMHGYNATCSAPLKDGAPNRLSHEHNSGSLSSMMTTEFEQSVSVGNKFLNTSNELSYGGSLHNSHAVVVTSGRTGAHMNEDEGGKSSECSESSSIQNNSKLLECTSERGVMGSSALSTAPLPNNPPSYPPFPFLAVPYPYTIAGATSTTIPVQAGFPLPFLVQYPSHSDNIISPLHGTFPIVSGVTPGLMAKANSGSKDCLGEGFEGKGGCGEKSAFTPLSRTSSNLKLVKEGPQCSGGQLESQATFSSAQLSSISSIGSDVCNTKNLLLERQQSVAFAGRLSSQSSNLQDQITLSSKQEALTQKGTDLQNEAPTLRGGSKAEAKQVDRTKVEEGLVESQLGREHSGVDAAYVQSGSVERQKSGSFLDLPLVTTTGKGPNGKTINGVLYIVDGRHVRLVCSCHGKHMSPVEFVEHSGSTDLSNPERSIVVSPVPSLNHHTASAAV